MLDKLQKSIFFFKKKIVNIISLLFKLFESFCYLLIPIDKHDDGCYVIARSKTILLVVFGFIIILILKLFLILTKNTYAHKYNYFDKNRANFSKVEITDRNGKILASNIIIYDLYLQSSQIENIEQEINKVNKILKNTIKNKQEIIKKLNERKENGKKVFIKSGIQEQTKQLLEQKHIQGLFFEKKEKRFYTSQPSNNIVGYCTPNNNCISGIEKSMFHYIQNTNNKPLQLSIDDNIQTIVRNILYDKIEETQSKGATGLIMDIKTGEILAGVSLPDCDFNNYGECSQESLFNNYSFGAYELGSVFKLFLAGLALQSGISPNKIYKREEYKLDNFTIHDIDRKDTKGGNMTLVDIVRLSSNVGCAKVMEEIDLYKQFLFLSRLGLLKKINTELPETCNPVYPKKWTLLNGITISYGHGISVSPLQYTTAIASLLNNKYINPTFLRQNEKNIKTEKNNNYLDEDKYEIFKDIMRQVINSGAGKGAYIDQYDIGGKTGTAIQSKNGKYDRYSMILSFVAAIPMYKPRYVFFITLHYPKTDASNNYLIRAGNVLSPTMKEIISTIGPILGIKPI